MDLEMLRLKLPALTLRTMIPALAWVMFLCLILPHPPAEGGQKGGKKEEELNPRQRSELDTLIRAFWKEKDPRTRIDLASRIRGPGPAAAAHFLNALDKEVNKRLKGYEKKLIKVADSIYKQRLKEISSQTIKSLRDRVNSLRKITKLTKDEIIEKGDPALLHLKSLLLIDTFEFVGLTEELQEARDGLMELTNHQQACRQIMGMEVFQPGWAIDWIETRAAALPVFRAAGQADVLEANKRLAPQIHPAESEGVLDLNLLRLVLGRRALRIDVKLCDAGRDHSKDMQALGFFAHESPVKGKENPFKRAANFGTAASAENIYMGSPSGVDANRSWFHSPGHHKNMLTPGWSIVGLGRTGLHWTQLFR
jgi:hypothetical protein